jgi:hypothetical protein
MCMRVRVWLRYGVQVRCHFTYPARYQRGGRCCVCLVQHSGGRPGTGRRLGYPGGADDAGVALPYDMRDRILFLSISLSLDSLPLPFPLPNSVDLHFAFNFSFPSHPDLRAMLDSLEIPLASTLNVTLI